MQVSLNNVQASSCFSFCLDYTIITVELIILTYTKRLPLVLLLNHLCFVSKWVSIWIFNPINNITTIFLKDNLRPSLHCPVSYSEALKYSSCNLFFKYTSIPSEIILSNAYYFSIIQIPANLTLIMSYQSLIDHSVNHSLWCSL